MASLRRIIWCCLLLLTASSLSQNLPKFNCSPHVKAKFNDSVQLTCNATTYMKVVVVWQFQNDTRKTLIKTSSSSSSSDDKRMILNIQNTSSESIATLTINNVNVSDAGIYNLFLEANGGHKNFEISLEVEVPYRNLNMAMHQSAIVCEARGGNSEGQIYWFDGYQKNWTKSAEMISNKMKDGSFVLTSTLYLKPLSIMEEYCCTVVYTLMGHARNISSCNSTNRQPQGQVDNEESRKIHLFYIIPIAVMACVALMICFHSGQRHLNQGQRLLEIAQCDNGR